MTYATRQDMIDRYGDTLLVDLTDRGDVATGLIDEDTLDQALEDATDEVTGYLKRYKLPLAEVPRALVAITSALAIYQLYVHEVPDKHQRDYDNAQKRLREIQSGVFVLDVEGVAPDSSGAGGVRVTDRERPMTEDNLKSFI